MIAAGALLEDTQQPRLVAQMKLHSVSDGTLESLTVAVECLNDGGNCLGTVNFTDSPLSVRRGQRFGPYTAIVLPYAETTCIRVSVRAAVFCGGERWTAPDGASWSSLPSFAAPAVTQPAATAPAAPEDDGGSGTQTETPRPETSPDGPSRRMTARRRVTRRCILLLDENHEPLGYTMLGGAS